MVLCEGFSRMKVTASLSLKLITLDSFRCELIDHSSPSLASQLYSKMNLECSHVQQVVLKTDEQFQSS